VSETETGRKLPRQADRGEREKGKENRFRNGKARWPVHTSFSATRPWLFFFTFTPRPGPVAFVQGKENRFRNSPLHDCTSAALCRGREKKRRERERDRPMNGWQDGMAPTNAGQVQVLPAGCSATASRPPSSIRAVCPPSSPLFVLFLLR
jgi:hypothetical protein